MTARIGGFMIPAMAPCTIRQATSSPGPDETPHSTDAAVNPASPIRYVFLWPIRSPSRPPGMSSSP